MLFVAVTSGAILGVTGSGAAAALRAGPPPPVPYDPATGRSLVSEAKQIASGESRWTGGCVPGAGAPRTLFAEPACAASVTKAHPAGYGDNGKYGLDCSGFVRWVYFLVYGQDVLGPGTTAAQQSQAALAKVPAAQRQPGDLVFFPGYYRVVPD